MDSIAQFLTVIRNASHARNEKVDVPSSKMREGIAKVLSDKGFIRSFKVAKDSKQGIMRIYLKYDESGVGAISSIKKVSTPGRRVYVGYQRVPRVRSGLGLSILSTSKGIMSDKEATEKKIGGERLCTIW